MSYTRSKYFTKGLQMNMAGFERVDELLGKARKNGWTREQLANNVSFVFDLKGASLTRFMKNIDY